MTRQQNHSTTQRTTSRRNRAQRRGREGMAMLLVMVLIVMVSAAGVFATKSASLDVRSAGFMRQASQTQYVSEMGLMLPMSEMRRFCSAYLGLMLQQQRAGGAVDPWLEERRMEWRFGLDDMQRPPAGGGAAPIVFRQPTGAGAGRVPGSFGMGLADAAFDTRVIVLGRVPGTMYGFPVDGRMNMVAFSFESQGRMMVRGVNDPARTGTGTTPSRAVSVIPCEL